MTEERKVKGIVIAGMVEIVHRQKDQPWEEHLTPEDMKIINFTFLPSEWYPVGFTQRLVTAFVKIYFKGDVERIKSVARLIIDDTITGPLKHFILVDDPYKALKKITDLQNMSFNFVSSTVESTGEKELVLRASELGETDENFDYFIIFLSAQIEELALKNGARNIVIKSAKKNDGRGAVLELTMSWE